MSSRLVLAIDPGPERSACLIWDPVKQAIEWACVEDNREALNTVRHSLDDGLTVAIEAVTCYGRPAGGDVFETCYWIGRFDADQRCQLVPYRDVSRNLCRISGASSAQIYAALRERFGQPGTKKAPGTLYPVRGNEHLRSALALAVYVGDATGVERALK